jgi:8-amino-7-oxononanoate synthase
MYRNPASILSKLSRREREGALRELTPDTNLVDFSSNDYLGFARNPDIFEKAHDIVKKQTVLNGATGSRLLSGNHELYGIAEAFVAAFHQSPAALFFNSGYDANVGLLSAVPQRGDVILYDELCHASIRDGIRLSLAKAYKFAHNDIEDLAALLEKHKPGNEIYVVTESVFSMDGDSPNLAALAALCDSHGTFLIVDEAHALGVFGDNGQGLVQHLGLENRIFARVMTFGKGLGCHGAAVLGSTELRDYLVNFARSFIYTTGLPPHSVATVLAAYRQLTTDGRRMQLTNNIAHFNREIKRLSLAPVFVYGKSAIRSAIIPGNKKVRDIAAALQDNGFDVKAILSPTVPQGLERLRICLHSYNTADDITRLLETLASLLF